MYTVLSFLGERRQSEMQEKAHARREKPTLCLASLVLWDFIRTVVRVTGKLFSSSLKNEPAAFLGTLIRQLI